MGDNVVRIKAGSEEELTQELLEFFEALRKGDRDILAFHFVQLYQRVMFLEAEVELLMRLHPGDGKATGESLD